VIGTPRLAVRRTTIRQASPRPMPSSFASRAVAALASIEYCASHSGATCRS
jgi:hypothetical protein